MGGDAQEEKAWGFIVRDSRVGARELGMAGRGQAWGLGEEEKGMAA